VACVTVRRGGLGSVQDATLSAGTPGGNFGSDGELVAGATSGGQSVALVRFDLSPVPARAQVTSAKLGLFTGECCSVESVNVHLATAAWSEGDVTWASFGGAYSPAAAGEITTCAQPSVLDVTAAATAWHAHAATNFGVALVQAGAAATAFRSSEAATATDRPALQVCYVVPDCGAGTGDCDGIAANGCETNTLASATSCGGCGDACAFANAGASCVAGACVIGACEPGFVDCNGNPLDGCEVAPGSDPDNCGACGEACDNPHGTAACSGGACVATCANGYGTCDGDEQNGCETPLSSLFNCGGCGETCALANANVTCQTGTCDVVSCQNDFGNCDNDASNGCEAPLNSLQHCGGCGKACAIENASATCQTGICKLGVCTAPFGNCDAVPYNGCESNFQTDVNHCGNCSTKCTNAHGSTSCNGGTCAPVCVGLWASCDNSVVNGCPSAHSSTPTWCPFECRRARRDRAPGATSRPSRAGRARASAR